MTRCAALVLAAGAGTRFRATGGEGPSKLVAPFEGVPMVRVVAEAALASRADPVIVVTGHAADAVEQALVGLAVIRVTSHDHRLGLAHSLKAGITALPAEVAGTVVLLGDMPRVGPDLIDRLLDVADTDPHADAIVPMMGGRRGNPVLLSRRLFSAVGRLEGDTGARHLLEAPGLRIREVETDDQAIVCDIDVASDLHHFGGGTA